MRSSWRRGPCPAHGGSWPSPSSTPTLAAAALATPSVTRVALVTDCDWLASASGDARGDQPGAAARRLRRLRRRPRPRRGARRGGAILRTVRRSTSSAPSPARPLPRRGPTTPNATRPGCSRTGRPGNASTRSTTTRRTTRCSAPPSPTGSPPSRGPARPVPARTLRRAIGFVVWSQVDAGHGCPVSMTYAAVPALRHDRELAARWVPRLAARDYEPELRPLLDKTGALCGMGMTEKQGGSDLRANTHPRRGRGRRTGPRRRLPAHRPQVVLLGADERRLPHARAGPGRPRPASSCRECWTTGHGTHSPSSG